MERLSREDRRRQTRDRLLDAAQELIAARGLGVSLDEVAAAAGLTKGAVYSNFAGKEELLLAIIERKLTNPPSPDTVDTVAAGVLDDDPVATLSRPEHRDFLVLLLEFWTEATRNERVRARYAEGLRVLRSHMDYEVAQRLDLDRLPVSPLMLAKILLALDLGLAVQHAVDPNEDAAALYGAAVELLFGNVRKD